VRLDHVRTCKDMLRRVMEGNVRLGKVSVCLVSLCQVRPG
jgi:hypothetical protein